jgi:hypothetical protein
MQKVEGSSPFIRFDKPRQAEFFVAGQKGAPGRLTP